MAPFLSFSGPVVLSSTLKNCQIGPLECTSVLLSSSSNTGVVPLAEVEGSGGLGADDLTLPGPPFLRSPHPLLGPGGTKSGSRSLSSCSLSEAKRTSSLSLASCISTS